MKFIIQNFEYFLIIRGVWCVISPTGLFKLLNQSILKIELKSVYPN